MSAAEQDNQVSALAVIFPHEDRSRLRHFLAASNNSLERATNALLRGQDAIVGSSSKRRKLNTGLDSWLSNPERRVEGESAAAPLGATVAAQSKVARTKGGERLAPKSAFELLRPLSPAISAPATATATPALPPITLTTPHQIRVHTQGLVTLIPDVLPKELAARLFLRMVDESLGIGREDQKPWEKNRWYLVNREVESPHTTSFYVESGGTDASVYDQEGFAEAARYWYNGQQRPARPFTPEMDEAREVIGPLVRRILAARKRLPLEYEGEWTPNVAAANCYRGSKESVGWHSDILTYLGPYPTIASLTLGVTRPFRLRAVMPTPAGSSSGGSTTPAIAPRTLSIPLPHGSLLIMHAGCQEKFKHCVPEVNGMDVFRLPKGLGLESFYPPEKLGSAFRERINMTFRCYREDFAPRQPSTPWYIGTPICRCGVPCQLRPDARGRSKASLGLGAGNDGDDLCFFWTCNAGAQNQGKTCGMWELLDMKKEGRGKWFQGVKGTSKKAEDVLSP